MSDFELLFIEWLFFESWKWIPVVFLFCLVSVGAGSTAGLIVKNIEK